MKKLYILYALILSIVATAQRVRTDTIINTGIYKSYYSYSLREPLYVTYHLFKGGGDCDRKKEHFRFAKGGIDSADNRDYAHTGYDEGHLVNAEDFAFDCEKEKMTFFYYNCVPQKAKMNRGIWKSWESKVRDLSQSRKLFVIAGSIFSDKTLGKRKIGLPDSCYKIVLDAVTKEILYCLWFPNDDSKRVEQLSLNKLKTMLGYDLVP